MISLKRELLAAAPLLACLLVLPIWPQPRYVLPILGLAVVFYFLGVLALSRSKVEVSGAGILLVAGLLRLSLLPLPPVLSTDVWRYLWDGRVLNAGENPYVLSPDASELEALRDDLWRLVDHREVPTVYPPLSLGLFSIATGAPHALLTWKLLVLLADMGICACLLLLARSRGSPVVFVAWYAWNPLAVLEGVGMGHLEPIAVFFVVLTVLLLVKRRAAWAAVAAALGVAAKLGPLAAVPMWARQSRRPALFSGISAGLCLVFCLPLLSGARGLGIYAVSWEFNGPLYEPLWRWLQWLEADVAIKSFLAAVETWSGDHRALDPVYAFVYPRLLAKLILAAAAAVLVVRSAAWKLSVEGSGALFGGLLLCAATLYPWYLLWVLPWAALTRHRAFLALSATSLLCYLPQVYGVSFMPWVFFLVWAPFWFLLWRSRWRID